MTIPAERTRSVQMANEFLCGLIRGEYKRVPVEVKEVARVILRHYPTAFDLASSARSRPDLWGKPE